MTKPLRLSEFVALMALMTSLVALSIDAMLPALSAIGQELGVVRANDYQLVISVLFLGLALGQLGYGPLSDSVGRKPAVYLGLALFIAGCVLSIVASDFNTMLAGRFLQGVGAAGPRTVTLALVRDQYEGRAMAKIMSSVMAVFILVPAVAPALGQLLLLVAHWRAIFWLFTMLAVIIFVWFAARQPETLPPARRLPFSIIRIAAGVRETCVNRVAFGYIVATGLVFGGFLGYLSSSPQLFQDLYGVGEQFPAYFAVLALAIGAASYLNSKLVMRYGMQLLCGWALRGLVGLAVGFFTIALLTAGKPPLWTFMAYCLPTFACFGLLFGNLNALAMQPLGHIAGVGAAVVGSLSTLISVPLGIAIGQGYNDTVLPLVGGIALMGLLAGWAMRWAAGSHVKA